MENFLNGLLASGLYLAAVVFDENSLVPLGTIGVIGGGIWWLGRKLQSLEDGQINLNIKMKEMREMCRRGECKIDNTDA